MKTNGKQHISETRIGRLGHARQKSLLGKFGDGLPRKARRGMPVILAKTALSSTQNMEGCATTKELRDLTNRSRRIQRLKHLKALGKKEHLDEIKRLEKKIGGDEGKEKEIKERVEVLEKVTKDRNDNFRKWALCQKGNRPKSVYAWIKRTEMLIEGNP